MDAHYAEAQTGGIMTHINQAVVEEHLGLSATLSHTHARSHTLHTHTRVQNAHGHQHTQATFLICEHTHIAGGAPAPVVKAQTVTHTCLKIDTVLTHAER